MKGWTRLFVNAQTVVWGLTALLGTLSVLEGGWWNYLSTFIFVGFVMLCDKYTGGFKCTGS